MIDIGTRIEECQGWTERVARGEMPRIATALSDPQAVHLGTGRALRNHDHAAIIYWDRNELLETVVPFLQQGLLAEDKVVYVADDIPLLDLELALRRAGTDVAGEVQSGRLLLTTAASAYFQDGLFDVERALDNVRALAEAAEAEGYRRVRMATEMTYLLNRIPGIERAPELESRMNDEIFELLPFVSICSFNGSKDVGDVISDVLRTHPVLLADGLPLANPYYRPWEVLKDDVLAQARWECRPQGGSNSARRVAAAGER